MDRYRQRTIAELLKKTSKLIKPRMTPILEGKDRMQGPLDITDPNIDFALLQVCGNCRNHLDASIAQNCGICNKGHHSFCLEAPLNEAGDRSAQCCYDCQQKAALDSKQPGSSLKDSHSELLEDRMDVCQSSENVPECEEPGTSYDASDRSPVSKKMHFSWNEASPSAQTADIGGTVFDTLYKPTKTRAARKLGIRRKRVTDGFGSDSPVLPSETDTPMPLQESSGVDAASVVEGVLPTCLEGGSEESKDLDHIGSTTADIQTNTSRMRSKLEEANGNQLLEVHVGSPSKYAEYTLEETVTADKLAKKGNATETKKSTGSPKLDVAVPAQPVSSNSCMPSDASTTLEAPSTGNQEEVRAVGPQTSRDLAKEQHFSNKTYAAPQMIVEEDDGERQILIVRQVSSVEELPKQDNDANRLLAMPSHVDWPLPNVNQGIRSPIAHRAPAFDGLKNKPSSSSVLDGPTEDEMRKPSFFVDMKRALPSIQEELVEHLSNGLTNKAGLREWLPHKEHPSPKAHHMDIDSNFTGSEITAASLGSPNNRAVMEEEIKVCDLCGDSGYEDMLAICNECNGAEHVYCYENLMAQIPEGDWQCDVCKSKQKAGDFRPSTDIRTVNSLPSRSPSFNSSKKHSNVGSSRSRLSALLQKRRLPSEKKRAMKGIPSSQFPAKRGLPVVDAPPTKKQAVEASSPPYTASVTSLKLGLMKEASFKIPETGKVKFVSHTALMGPTGEGTSLSSRGSGKFSLSTGSPSSVPHNSNMAQSGQMSKGRFSNASNSILGPGNARVNSTNQSNMPSSSSPVVSSGLKTPAALKSSESIPSYLLPLKPMGSKLQPSLRSFKETSDNMGLQSPPKEGSSGQSSTRTLSKTSSFKLSKGPSMGGALDPKLRQDVNLDSAKSSGSRNVPPQVGLVKAVESKYEAVLNSGLPEIKSKGLAPIESSERQNGVDKLIKKEPAGSLRVTKDETVLAASGACETQQSSILGSPVKHVQDLSTEQDTKSPFQETSPHSVARQTPKLSEEVQVETLKEESMTSMDVTESAPLLPRFVGPVLVIQESSTFKEDENKPLQLAVTVDVDGDKNVLAVEKTPTHDDNRSSFTPRSRSFGAWVSPSYVPSLGSTRCYRCKELGHSAKNCNNRSPTVCVSSEAAGALKAALPASNADSTSVSKGATPGSMDDVTRNVQSNVESIPKIKPTPEMAPILKASSTEKDVVFTQNLNSLVSEGPPQVEEDQVVEDVTPSPSPLMDQGMIKDATVLKQIAECLIKVCDGGGHHTDNTRETADVKEEDDNTSMRLVSSTIVNVSSGPQSITSSAEWQPPLLSLPSLTRSAAHMSPALMPVSSSNVKATSPFVSRYQESLKVYPEAQIVWQGTFEVAGKANPQVSFHGLQANPSNRALSKVREVAKKLQPLLPLEELPRGSEHNSWPAQFQKSPPINDNIALYFFASGKESYVQYYKPLVDRLIKFDLTLKGFIEDAELLIFPSNLLPPGSQCWNNFMFLWAVFRARKLPIKQSNLYSTSDSKQSGSDIGPKQPLQSGVLTWGKAEDMQIDTIATKTIDIQQAAGSRSETSSAVVEGANIGRHCGLSDSDVVVSDPPPPCQQEPQHLIQGEAAAKEEQMAQTEPLISQPEKASATVLPSTQDSIAVKSQPFSDVLLATEGGLNLNASNESPQKFNSSIKLEEKVETSMKLVVPSAPKVSSVLVRSEHGSIEKAKHSTPLMGTLPALLVCPSPRDRQEDVWTPRKLSSHSPAGHQDKDKGVRDRLHEKSDKMESGRGVSRDRDRERQREREKHKERDRDRDRSRRHSDWERERERERGKERERDRDRDRDRDRGRERERERDRERWRDREGRDRRGRDWDRDRDKVGDREKARDRGREREAERERALTRDRSGRHRHWDPAEADYGRSGRHWHRYPRSRSPSRSPPGNRDSSPSRPWLDRYHRYHRSFRHSRSYSHSPDSDHGLARLQPRAESRDLSKDSFAPKGKSPDTVAGDSRAKEESAVKNSVVKDSGGDEQGNYSQRGSNSNSLCRENSAGKERKLPIADLNLSPSEIEGNEEEGNDDDVMMSVEVVKPLNAHQDDHTSGCHDFLPADGLVEEPGECSNSAGKTINNQSTEHLMCADDSRSLSLINDSSGPSYFPLSVSLEGSSSCLQFFPQPVDDDNRALSTPDLSLALGAKEQSSPQQAELPLFRQLLEPCQGSLRGGSFNPSLNVPTIAEQADLSLSLAIPEHSKRPVVNTSLRLFG